MLVLSRQRDQSIMIGDDVEVKVVDIRGDKVRLGFLAGRDVSIHRAEVYEAIKRENRAAAEVVPEQLDAVIPRPVNHAPVERDIYMEAAIDEARAARAEGGVPIGAVLVRGEEIIGRGRDSRHRAGNELAFAEVECLRNARLAGTGTDAVLYVTNAPGHLAAGAIIQFGISKLVIGQSRHGLPDKTRGPSAINILRSHMVAVTELQDAECIAMMRRYLNEPHR